MAVFRISEAARLLGVSDDTLRRWADAGRVAVTRTQPRGIEGRELARFAVELAHAPQPERRASMRNHFTGIVTNVVRDQVMAQVEMQAGPHRIVSLISSEAVEQLGLEPGVLAVASVKATNVVVSVPDR